MSGYLHFLRVSIRRWVNSAIFVLKKEMNRKSKTSSPLVGIFLIVTGTALLFYNLDLIPLIIPGYIFSWKSLILALGIVFILSERDKTAGIVLASIGIYFLIPEIWNINPWEKGLFWPFLLMVVGISILLSKRNRI
jgi:CDP-diglyceride synthetase